MEILDNISSLFGDDLKSELVSKRRADISAASFSIQAYAALSEQLRDLESFRFLFTGPSFATDHGSKAAEHRKFIIPPAMNRRDIIGSPFEIRLRNKMTTRALARECAEWIRSKGQFKSNPGAPVPSFLCLFSDS